MPAFSHIGSVICTADSLCKWGERRWQFQFDRNPLCMKSADTASWLLLPWCVELYVQSAPYSTWQITVGIEMLKPILPPWGSLVDFFCRPKSRTVGISFFSSGVVDQRGLLPSVPYFRRYRRLYNLCPAVLRDYLLPSNHLDHRSVFASGTVLPCGHVDRVKATAEMNNPNLLSAHTHQIQMHAVKQSS